MKTYLHILALMFIVALTGCRDDDGLDVCDIDVPEDYALSAGISTVFENSSYAYDIEAGWVSGNLYTRFQHGNRLYDNVVNNYGPVYAGYSCGSCHQNAGRTKPSVWNLREDGSYGSGAYGFSAMLVYITRKNGAFFQDYGRVVHDQSIYGVKPEGRLKVDWHYETFSFPDGDTYELARPEYTITDWYADSIVPSDLFCTVRIPLRHVGMGQLMALDTREIERVAKLSNYPEYGISGRCNYIVERGVKGVGVSGNKAQHQDLTVELGFSSDMGATNSRYPEEICEGQSQMTQGSMMGLTYDRLEVSTEDMENVDLYMQSLGVPARRLGSKSQKVSVKRNDGTTFSMTERELTKRGEEMFYKAKCHLCHVATLHTLPRGSVLLAGTQLPWLGNQTIHPYSDFLLHDMGSEIMGKGLNDNYVSGLARGNEWRTTPLWGIGLQSKVNGHTYFLHDGRARNFIEAIMWHGGEGEASKNLFKHMPRQDRTALVQFLKSL